MQDAWFDIRGFLIFLMYSSCYMTSTSETILMSQVGVTKGGKLKAAIDTSDAKVHFRNVGVCL